jgi:glycerol-3-phosphate dehydrogenase
MMWRANWRSEFWLNPDRSWDVIVIGGGIVGAGILRHAAKLGLRTLLVEQRDFGWGTSSRSTKFVHGGLRYIAEFQFRMTWESVHERKHLLKDGHGLIQPLDFLIAHFKGDRPGALPYRLGLMLYDLMGSQHTRRHYSKQQLLALEPHLRDNDLLEGFGYSDAQTDDARLTLRVISEGIAAGGTAINYARAESLLHDRGRIVGVVVRDQTEDRCAPVHARIVINATGAWADVLRTDFGLPKMIRPLRGSHLVFSSERVPVTHALSVNHPIDGRHITIAPWEGVTVVGSTDLDHRDSLDNETSITPFEVSYLMGAAEKAFPALGLTLDDVLATYAGIRPIVDTGQADPSHMPREPRIAYENGLLTVAGGKLTTYRSMAVAALRAIPRDALHIPALPDFPALDPITVSIPIPEPQKTRLLGRYGNRVLEVVQAAQPGDLDTIPGTNSFWVELRWAARNEAVAHLDDLLLRRVRLGLLLPQGARSLLPRIRAVCQTELGWDDSRWESERSAYLALWERCYSLPPRDQIPDWHVPPR